MNISNLRIWILLMIHKINILAFPIIVKPLALHWFTLIKSWSTALNKWLVQCTYSWDLPLHISTFQQLHLTLLSLFIILLQILPPPRYFRPISAISGWPAPVLLTFATAFRVFSTWPLTLPSVTIHLPELQIFGHISSILVTKSTYIIMSRASKG